MSGIRGAIAMTRTRYLRTRFSRDGRESGTVLVIVVVFMVTALLMVALVIDLAQLRQDRASNRQTADLAVTAAATSLATPGGTGVTACRDAWDYFLANTGDAGTVTATPACATTFGSVCDPAVPRTATGRAGAYTVVITYPVPFGSSMLDRPDVVGGANQAFNGNTDGTACERIGVEIRQTRRAAFAGVAGLSLSDTSSRSVARAVSQFDQDGIIALHLLEETSCNVLTASGQASVLVESNGDKPGYISIDSSATGGTGSNACSNNNRFAVDAVGTQNSSIVAEATPSGTAGVLRMYALAPGQGNSKAYEPDDVTVGRVSPRPTPASRRIGRNPIDWRWNCTPLGRDGVGGTSDDCRFGTPAHLNALRSLAGTTGAPPGFQTYPRNGTPEDRCNLQPSDPPVVVPKGDWWINCPSGLRIANQVQFNGGRLVFQNGIDIGSSGSLTINVGNNDDAIVYLRDGDITKDAQAALRMYRTFVYLHNGRISMGAGSGQLEWVAPITGNFEDLALWTETSSENALGGQAFLQIEGVFFTPNSDPFTYTGQSVQEQRVNAQFLTRRMDVSGQGVLVLQPSPDRVATLPAWGAALIR